MNKTCEICGRKLITGRKYCYRHRSIGRTEDSNEDNKPKSFVPGIVIFFIMILFVLFIVLYVIYEAIKKYFDFIVITIFILIIIIYTAYKIIKNMDNEKKELLFQKFNNKKFKSSLIFIGIVIFCVIIFTNLKYVLLIPLIIIFMLAFIFISAIIIFKTILKKGIPKPQNKWYFKPLLNKKKRNEFINKYHLK